MNTGREKFSRVVKFSPGGADQTLLHAIETALEKQSHSNFSELCKQALQQFLSADITQSTVRSVSHEVQPTVPLVLLLEQQIINLQLRIARLEESGIRQHPNIEQIQQLLQQLSERLEQLERHGSIAIAPEPPIPEEPPIEPVEEPDPLLSRLAPLLDDF